MEKDKILSEIAEIRAMLQQLGAQKTKDTPQFPVGKTGVRTLFLF